MSEDDTDTHWWLLILSLILIAGQIVAASSSSSSSLQSDKEVLLELKKFLQDNNPFNRGRYTEWNNNSSSSSSSPCDWPGIICSFNDEHVTGINLSDYNISGKMFKNFSRMTQLTELDLSKNTIDGPIPNDLNRCKNLRYLNLSHNILEGELNLTGLTSVVTLDLTVNRLYGPIRSNFPALCNNLVTLNMSLNEFTGTIDDCFDECLKLQYLDLSANNFSGQIWPGLQRLRQFSVSENHRLAGEISPSIFTENCSLEVLDLSENHFNGSIPKEVYKCQNLHVLNLGDNKFTGTTPKEIGMLSNLVILLLGTNRLSREIPDSLLNLTQLAFLDYSWNSFGGDIQEIFGKFKHLQYLVLHGNYYTGGLTTSGILKLPSLFRLDLSVNNLTGYLPVELSEMPSLKYLFLAYNQFNGSIPTEFGNFPAIQLLDLSHNRLTGKIPPTIGKLNSLLWLMLANNSITGEIPHEIGNCSSLLWLNLANNRLSGTIPAEISNIAQNPTPTFESNRLSSRVAAGSGECMTMKRWIPTNYPPFNFVYSLLTRKSCRSIWDSLLKGYPIFPICAPGSMVRTLQITGYLQLTGNQFSGKLPPEIGKLHNFTLVHVGINNLSGQLPPEIANMPLMVLDVSYNGFSGQIPSELGKAKCLQNLDLSHNNFSGEFPVSLNNLTELSKFNVSYNPFVSGVVPSTGQLATFDEDSFLGDPLLNLPNFMKNSSSNRIPPNPPPSIGKRKATRMPAFLVFLVLTSSFLVGGILSLIFCIVFKTPADSPATFLSEDSKECHNMVISSGALSSEMADYVKVIHLDKTAFTYDDVKAATGNFSTERIIGTGGFGTVYRGVLPDGREVAVKKLEREGSEGEKEFKAEMEVLSCSGIGWPHPNLVPLYGWCLHGKEKLLVYEYMDGGSLEDLLPDRTRLTWQMRLDVAVDVARALIYLHHECFPSIVHRDVKASNVLLDKGGRASVTDFGLARVVDAGESHVSTMVAGTVGYVAPEYGQTWQATTKGDVYSFGVLAMELATGRRALDGGEECLVEWARRVIGSGRNGLGCWAVVPVVVLGSGLSEGADEMCQLLRVGLRCTAEAPRARPNMKEVLAMLVKIAKKEGEYGYESASPSQIVKVEILKLSIDSR